MSVYVDRLRTIVANGPQARRVGARNGHRWCHLLTDGDDEELHRFAAAIGMKREWFQDKGIHHYDLTPSRRALAVKLGAIEVDGQAFRNLLRAIRERNDQLARDFAPARHVDHLGRPCPLGRRCTAYPHPSEAA